MSAKNKNNNEEKEKKSYWIEIIGILTALTLIIVWYNFFSFNDKVHWDVRGQLGDSFGSLNALFSGLALAGIIFTILLQRKELNLQREELKLTRKEFASNRLTNILYQQIKIQEKAISEFTITTGGEFSVNHSGHSAFLYLYKNLHSFNIPHDDIRTEDEILRDKIAHYRGNLKEYLFHENQILDFAVKTGNSCRVIKGVLGNSEIKGEEMKQYTLLFFNNIGYTLLNVIQDIVITFDEYLKLPTRADNPPIDIGRMGLVSIFLKSVIEIKDLDYNRDESEIVKDLLK